MHARVHLRFAYFHERTLDFSIRTGTLREPSATNGIDFVHEDDTGLVFARVPEHFTDDTRRLADILVHNGAGDDLEEVCVEGRGHRSCKERLARSWWPIQEYALRWLDAHTEE